MIYDRGTAPALVIALNQSSVKVSAFGGDCGDSGAHTC
jgi:hypothetical protein